MSDIDDLLSYDAQHWRTELQHALDDQPERLAERVPSGSHQRWADRRMLAPLVGVAAILAVILGLWGFGVLPNRQAHDTDHPAATSPSPNPGISRTTTPAAGLSLQLNLAHTVVPADGRPIHGYVTATNNTGKPITISNLCNGWLAVGLTNSTTPFTVASGEVLCAAGHLPKGTSRHNITISTKYLECDSSRITHSLGGGLRFPACTGASRHQLPRLPVGRYHTVIETTGLSSPANKPIPTTIRLTRTR